MEIGAEKGEEKGQKGKKEEIGEKQVYQLSHILCDSHAFFRNQAVTSDNHPNFKNFVLFQRRYAIILKYVTYSKLDNEQVI